MKNIRFNRTSRKQAARYNNAFKAGYKAGLIAAADEFIKRTPAELMLQMNQKLIAMEAEASPIDSVFYARLKAHRAATKAAA